jgi:hypothetical protein
MAKVLSAKQLSQKRYKFLGQLPAQIIHSFGRLTYNFTMTVWGKSGNGKSSFMMDFLKVLMPYGKVLYLALEEGFEVTTQMNVLRNLSVDEYKNIQFADHSMTMDELKKRLKKKKSPRFIIVDSLQYWRITYEQYQELKEMFPNKTFLFISHAKGKEPDGFVAEKIRYDSAIKAHVQGFVVFISSRLGGNNPYIVWEEGARKYWKRKYQDIKRQATPSKELIEQCETKLKVA